MVNTNSARLIKNENLRIVLVEFVRNTIQMSVLYRKQCLNYFWLNYSCDYLKKISIQINVATDEGNNRNEIGH